MTTIPDADAAVAKADARLERAKDAVVLAADAWGRSDQVYVKTPVALVNAIMDYRAAVKARKALDRPALLTAEEAWCVWCSTEPKLPAGLILNVMQRRSIENVLDACLTRAVAVIEAIPTHKHMPGYRNLEDIRRALGGGK